MLNFIAIDITAQDIRDYASLIIWHTVYYYYYYYSEMTERRTLMVLSRRPLTILRSSY